MPVSRIFQRALSSAPTTSPSGGPSRIRRSRDSWSARADLDRIGRLCMVAAVLLIWCTRGRGTASLLARPRWGDRVTPLTLRREGERERCSWCSCCCWWRRCCEMMERGLAALAPRLWADCSFRRARCVLGEGGGWSVVMAASAGGSEGIWDSLVGLGIMIPLLVSGVAGSLGNEAEATGVC